MIGIRRCFGVTGLAIAAAGVLAISATTASAQQSFTAPAPDGYPPNWNRAVQPPPVTASFVPGSDAYHWTGASSPPTTLASTAVVYQMQPGSMHYHRIQ